MCAGRLPLRLFFCAFLLALACGLAPAQGENKSNQNWTKLDELLNQLENEAENLSVESERLWDLLKVLSSNLQASEIAVSALSSSLAKSDESWKSYVDSKDQELSRIRIELWAWRIGVVLGVAGVIVLLLR